MWGIVTDAQRAERERRQVLSERIEGLKLLMLGKLLREAREIARQFPDRRIDLVSPLNEASWNVVDPVKPKPTPEVARQALAVAELAVEYSEARDGLILDTLAAAHFANDDLDAALATERKAVRLLPDNQDLKAALARYEALAAQRRKP